MVEIHFGGQSRLAICGAGWWVVSEGEYCGPYLQMVIVGVVGLT